MITNKPFINVYKKRSLKSEVVTQLLYGELFTKIQKKGSWTEIKNNTDGYKGFIKDKISLSNIRNTHKMLSACIRMRIYLSIYLSIIYRKHKFTITVP